MKKFFGQFVRPKHDKVATKNERRRLLEALKLPWRRRSFGEGLKKPRWKIHHEKWLLSVNAKEIYQEIAETAIGDGEKWSQKEFENEKLPLFNLKQPQSKNDGINSINIRQRVFQRKMLYFATFVRPYSPILQTSNEIQIQPQEVKEKFY